jgi:hypothetical protein
MEVSRDDLSLPLAIADSAKELAELCGVTAEQVVDGASKSKKMKKPKYVKVEIEEDEV